MNSRAICCWATVLCGLLLGFVNAADAPGNGAADNATIERQYASWKATLSPERQAWETVLQQNLGKANRLAYERQKVEGRPTEYDYVEDDPRLPRVLLLGDSISCGYTLPVRAALAGRANVHRAPENCGSTENGVKKLDIWLGKEKWDVIHFNFGIHDCEGDLAAYERRLEEIVTRLQKTGAKLIWASTTPVLADTAYGAGAAGAVRQENEIATRIMKRHGIATDDLYSFALPRLPEIQNPQDVHFKEGGYRLLGEQVAKAIGPVLK